ncbi:MAG: deoxyribodipyrimidine photo-lyase, partial [Rhodothermales bacterium]|nr:deoxyribodipyrimidine photo-lyase [Rhodothermales bacterium]
GGAARRWLHHSLDALDAALEEKASRLILRTGPSLHALRDCIAATGAGAVYWTRRYEPALRERDEKVRAALEADGIAVETFDGYLLHDPQEVQTTSGGSYRVFTSFWRRLKAELEVPPPLSVPYLGARRAPEAWPDSVALEALELLPEAQDGVDWAGGMREMWVPGAAGAHDRLDHFVDEALEEYPERRDRPDLDGTSTLSPHLHWGEVSPRQVWHATLSALGADPIEPAPDWDAAAEGFLSELAWREFSYHVLVHHPETPDAPMRPEYDAFPARSDAEALRRWQRGETGYPIVDAGMNQLWYRGWMHNRVRMITASFLVKHLLLPWWEGARWFWDTLVGADLANNTMGWQWTAGSGADAQPFFRIFNPLSQAKKFDPEGAYVRTWLPQLADLPTKYVHTPWEAPEDVLEEAGVRIGETYPAPIVEHKAARERALEAYEDVKRTKESA